MVRALTACCLIAVAVGVGLAVAASATPGARCQPTVSDAGPFQTNAIATPRRAKIGTGHVLLGQVLSPACTPVRRALVVLWQAGLAATVHAGEAVSSPTGRGGSRFEGPVPATTVADPAFHLAVVHPAYEDLLTRYTPVGVARRPVGSDSS